MLKIFKDNKRKWKYIIVSIIIITILLLSTTILTIVNKLIQDDNNMIQIAKATETYSYNNPYVPKGFTHSEGTWDTGFVIKETATQNEFVWIPVNASNLKLARSEFAKTFSNMALSADTLDASFNTSITKYGGYYVGRYEAGVGSTNGNNVGIPVCKKGATVWRNISRNNAISSAQKMYQTNEELISSLMSSYAYDTMLTWLKTQNYSKSIYNVDTDSSSWGNYRNNSSSNGSIQVAGNNANWKANNIYDIAGNVWEWTTENYGNDAVVRGGDALSNGSVLPAGTRDHASPTSAFDYTGFRVLLYRDVNFVDKPTSLAIVAGANNVAYLDSNYSLWMWGKNTYGQLGNGTTTTPVATPSSINTGGIKFKEITINKSVSSTGSSVNNSTGFTAGISTDEYLYTWGYNGSGQLGNGTSGSTSKNYVLTPQKITITDTNGREVKLQKVSAGYKHCIAIDTSGNLWAWGSNASYTTGLNKNTGTTLKPTQITSGTEFKEISAANYHNMALDKSGNLYTWGASDNYKLCTGEKKSIKTPTKVDTGTYRFKKVAAASSASFAIDTTDQLWGCGANGSGTQGNGTTTTVQTFTRNITGTSRAFKDISIHGGTIMGIDTADNLWGWGWNVAGQLGNGTTTKETSPIQILAGKRIKKVSVGGNFFIAVDENEDVWTCGSNWHGVLGNGLVTTSSKSNHSKVPINISIE